jgi:hypothetical protein
MTTPASKHQRTRNQFKGNSMNKFIASILLLVACSSQVFAADARRKPDCAATCPAQCQ